MQFYIKWTKYLILNKNFMNNYILKSQLFSLPDYSRLFL